MKTHYQGHDDAYIRLRKEGAPGWERNGNYTQTFAVWERVLRAGRAPVAGRLLELGCGAGNSILWFAARRFEVSGVDIAPSAISWAKERASAAGVSANFLVGDVRRLESSADTSFDFVLDGHCLHCIIGEDRAQVLREAFRVLVPGGFFLVHTMCGPRLSPPALADYNPETRCAERGGISMRYFGLPEEICTEVLNSGFEVLHSEIIERVDEEDQDTVLIEARRPFFPPLMSLEENNLKKFGIGKT